MKRILSFLTIAFPLIFFAAAALCAVQGDEEYLKARECYGALKGPSANTANRASWEHCVSLFEGVSKQFPQTERGGQALFTAGRLRAEMYGKFKKLADVDTAIAILNQFIRQYPKSTLTDDALYTIARFRREPLKDDDRARRAFTYIVENYPNGDMASKARSELGSLGGAKSDAQASAGESLIKSGARDDSDSASPFSGEMAGPQNTSLLTAIEIGRAEGETSVSLMLTRRAAYSLKFSSEGVRTGSPPRLDMLLAYTKAAGSLGKDYAVTSPYLSRVMVKRDLLGGGIRLVFEMKHNAGYEVRSQGESIVVHFKQASGVDAPPPRSTTEGAKVRTLGKAVKEPASKDKKFVIVIDPGHGGSDTGALGPGGLMEKGIALSVAKKLASTLKEGLDAKIHLTRSDDSTLTLEDRNAIAVSKKADLFISVHANASTDKKMSGIETYFLNNASDRAADKLAKRENRAARKKLSAVEHILSTMLQNYDAAESELLASDVQKSLMGRMGKKYTGVRNRRVRSALFYVLVGAKCPAILVETSFISNPREAARLRDHRYQADLAKSIAEGVQKYIRSADHRMVKL